MDAVTSQSVLVVLVFLCALLLLWQASWYLLVLASRILRLLPRRIAGLGVWAGAHPLRAVLAQRFPKSYGFISRRLDRKYFPGLPLTLLVAAAVYVLMLLGGIVAEVVEEEEINRFDRAVN